MFVTKYRRERDEARAIAERQAGTITDLRNTLIEADKRNEALDRALQEKMRELRLVGAALNEALSERDALREAAAARRAKQLANLRNQPKVAA